MKPEYRNLLIACLAVLVIDALGAIASKKFNFNYIYIGPVSILAYCTLGYTVSQITDIKTGVWITALLGIFDATIGWKFSIICGANTGKVYNRPTLQVWAITIVSVALYGAIIGLISGGAAKLINKQKQTSINTDL